MFNFRISINGKRKHKIFRITVNSIFLFGLVLLAAYSFIRRDEIIHEQRLHLEAELDRVELAISEFVNGYVHGLQGVAGLYSVNNFYLTSENYQKYARSRQFFNNFPGVLGYGFVRKVNALNPYLEKMQLISPDLKFRRLSKATYADYYIIETIEPLSTNKQALGLDVGSEAERRQSVDYATDSGTAGLTSAIQLVQVAGNEVGFLIFLPVYSSIEVPESVEERRRSVIGWAYAPIVSSKLFNQLDKTLTTNIKYEIFEEKPNEKNKEIYRNFPDTDDKGSESIDALLRRIPIGGKTWILKISASSLADKQILFWYPLSIFSLGFAFLVVLYFVILWIVQANLKNEKKAETAENWQKAILASTSYSIISTTADGLITLFNERAEEMLGYKSTELVGRETPGILHDPVEVVARSKTLTETLGQTVNPGFETFVVKALLDGSDTNEWTYIRKNKSRFPVRLCVTPIIDAAGVLNGFLGVAEDLSHQKKLEESIAENNARLVMASKMSSLGEMAGGIAHEINNPLSIISLRAQKVQILLQKESLKGDSLIKNELDGILKTVDRIAQIISGLRRFSRNAETDEMEYVSIAKIIDDTIELCAEKFKQNQISFGVDIRADAMVRCRPVQLSQVVMNLLTNAYDSIKLLQVKQVQVELDVVGKEIRLRVVDSGPGIDPVHIEKIFQPFYTTKAVGAGTGLGLSISLGIIQQHGGSLLYQLHNNKTSFLIILPVAHS